jgi:hypothetical protein
MLEGSEDSGSIACPHTAVKEHIDTLVEIHCVFPVESTHATLYLAQYLEDPLGCGFRPAAVEYVTGRRLSQKTLLQPQQGPRIG